MDRRVAFLGRGYDGGCHVAMQPKPARRAEVPSGRMRLARGREMMLWKA